MLANAGSLKSFYKFDRNKVHSYFASVRKVSR